MLHDEMQAHRTAPPRSSLTLREILDWEILSGHSVIAGANSLGSEVLSITVIDAPDAVNWIKAREFVVTSTYPVRQSPQALVALIEQLAARNAAGLGVKLTRFLRAFPDDARQRADELGLPIISLPGALAWSDLIGRVFADGGRQHSQMAQLGAIYRSFSQHRTPLGSLHELFELVSGFVNLPVLIALEDETGLQIESGGIGKDEAEALAETLIHGAAKSTYDDDTPERVRVGTGSIVVARTGAGTNGEGIVAVVERGQSASQADLECLRLSTHLLQALLEANASAQANDTGNARLLGDLINPLLAAEAKSLLVARGLPDAAWHLVVGRIFDPGMLDDALLTLRLRQFARRRQALLRVEDDGRGCMIAIPTSHAHARSDDALLREFGEIFERQSRRASGFRYGLGQAGPAALWEAATLHREAVEAMAFGVQLNGFNRLSRHDDILVMRLLAHPAVIEESRPSFLRLLDPLLEMGGQGRMLIETLRVWFQEDESIPRTAERLGLHVNTVRQRLDRCRTALRLTEFGTNTRLRLYVALQLLPMLKP